MKLFVALGMLFNFMFLAESKAAKAILTEAEKIEALLIAVRNSDTQFIRNGKDYSGPEAEEHLRRKLTAAEKSWFAPKKSEWTAALFIEKIASKSTLSGSKYQIRLLDGSQVDAKDWLFKKLKELEQNSN